MNLDLNGKRAVVCGSTQGIGRAAAIELALLGASITLVARNEEALKATQAALHTTPNQQHNYIVADFSQPDDLKRKIDAYAAGHEVHILVNNTGGPPGGDLINASLEEFTRAYAAHLVCNHILAQALVPGMKRAAYGRIVNIISTSVKAPLRGLGVSNTTRGAVANWSKTLAAELGPFGITVNNVLPGATMTARLESIMKTKAEKTGRSFEEVKLETAAEVPLRRICEPNEVANAVAFLATPAAGYINGINVPVDGGRTPSL